MAGKNGSSWVNYIKEFNENKIAPRQLTIEGIDKFISLQDQAFTVLNRSFPLIYLLDYTSEKYIFFSRSCDTVLNFSAEKMLAGGINFVLERYHPADLKLFNTQIFVDRLNMLKTISAEQHKDHIFSINYRVKNGKGEYVNLLQRNSFIQSDKEGNPLLSLGSLTIINHFKEENPVIQLVEKIDPITGNVNSVIKNTYYLHEEDKIFSKREKEILLWLAEGLTSKQIADKLFISEYTVINHKRNMHHKSNTQNSAALISFAFRQHLL